MPDFSKITDEVLLQAEREARGVIVRELPVCEEGFLHYNWCIFNRDLPPPAKHIWAPEFVNAFNNRTGVLLNCFRGATKSTFLVAWSSYVTGKRPVGSSQLARINDDAAMETDKIVAGIIEHNPGWKACFPNIVPDPDQGWSITGRFIKDTNVPYGKWRQKCTSDHLGEPSFQCAGITSGNIIGKHPSNGWYSDDLHDERNTRSQREMQTIVDVVEKNVIPTWTRPEGHPALGAACTLWNERDASQSMLKTGLLKHVRTPIYVLEENQYIMVGDELIHPKWIDDYPVETDLDGKRIKSLWYEAYPAEKIRTIQRSQPVYFPLSYLCDLSAAKGITLRAEWLHKFDHEKIDPSWPVYFGIDFASTSDRTRGTDTDFFTIAIVRAVPGGGIVLVDGFRDRLSFGEAVVKTKALASQYRPVIVAVEKWGSGEKFKDVLLYASNFNVLPYPLRGTPVKSKGKRFEEELAPMFTTGRAWISNLPNDFITAFKAEWLGWDGNRSKTGHDDALDAVYWACHAAQGHLMPVSDELIVESPQKKQSIYSAFGDNYR